MISDYKDAKNKLLTADIDGCQQFFTRNGCKLEEAYMYIYEDNLQEAEILFRRIKEQDIRAHWALVMLSFIKGDVEDVPSYFEIRNFLEIDLDILINWYKGDYVEKIVRYADYMFTINPEVHKFIGRVFWNNDLKEQALFFLHRAKDYFFHVPELHFLLALTCLDSDDIGGAIKALEDCTTILPGYFPAQNLLNKLKKTCL